MRLKYVYKGELYHHGILGQRWGVRRYQNKDGTLTPLGRQKLGIEKYEKEHSEDLTIKKGSNLNRFIRLDDFDFFVDDNGNVDEKGLDKYTKDRIKKDNSYDRKYVSAESEQPTGRIPGKEFYASWFTDSGWQPELAVSLDFKAKRDIKIASGKQVMEALLKEVGNQPVNKLVNQLAEGMRASVHQSVTLDYTNNRDNLFDRVNKLFQDAGYDGIEDVNDPDSDRPVILFKAKDVIGDPIRIQSGEEVVKEILAKRKNT